MAPERGSERDLSNLSYEFTVRTGSPIRPETLCAAICDMPGLALPGARLGTPKMTKRDLYKNRKKSSNFQNVELLIFFKISSPSTPPAEVKLGYF